MIYSREEAAGKIIESGLELVEKGLIARTWGNISARLSEEEFLITPSGMAYDALTPDMLVVCKIEDCSYEGDIKPSGEKAVHAQVYKNRADVDFIVHTHQLYGTVAGCIGRGLKARNDEEKAILGERVPVAAYAISATKPLGKKVAACVQKNPDSNAIFMKCHGVLCLGKDKEHAFKISETLEAICEELVQKNLSIDVESKLGWPEDYSADAVVMSIKMITGKEVVLFDHSDAVVRLAKEVGTVRPVIDDMAQIAGTIFPCISMEDEAFSSVLNGTLMKKGVVYVENQGAVIASETEEEAEAIAMVLEKDALAHLFQEAKDAKRELTLPDAMYQRRVYVKKYSKLKK